MSIRTYRDVPRVYLDLDGPLADFEGYCKDLQAKLGSDGIVSPAKVKLVPGTYFNLPVVEGAKDAVSKILDLGLEIMILTKIPSKNPLAASEKILWLNKHFPELDDMITITPDKGSVGSKRDFLVDDRPDWANAHNFRGTIIQYGSPAYPSWDEIITYLNRHLAWTR